MLSIGKIRGLQQVTNQLGIFTICAMDHRGSLRGLVSEEHTAEIGYDQMVAYKRELCASLSPHASAVLLDPIFGAAQCISHRVLPSNTGLLVSLEASGYEGGAEHRETRVLDGWGVAKIKRMGASAAKLLLYYRPDLEPLAGRQREIVGQLAQECAQHDLPFLVEPKSYPVGDEVGDPERFAALKGSLVVQTARDITALPIDVLKAEFPADLRYQPDRSELVNLCQQLDQATPVPWVILSAGVDFETFCQQVAIACEAGASGFLGGRAIWQEALNIEDARERVQYLDTVVVNRIKRLNEIANKHAVPWYRKLGMAADNLVPITESWYAGY